MRKLQRLALALGAAAILLGSLGILAFSHPAAYLRWAGRWLIVSDPLKKADAIVVIGGNLPFRSEEAARLFRDGWAPRVWITAPEGAAEVEAVKLLGLGGVPREQLSARVLERFGVPESAISVLSPRVTDTNDEIHVIVSAMSARGFERVILVTSPSHTRRVRAICGVLAHFGQECIVRHDDVEHFDPDRWWVKPDDRSRVDREAAGLAYTWLALPFTRFLLPAVSTRSPDR